MTIKRLKSTVNGNFLRPIGYEFPKGLSSTQSSQPVSSSNNAGTVVKSGGNTYLRYTGAGNFTPTTDVTVEFLLVGGGGRGGHGTHGHGATNGGGGGGGGVVYNSSYACVSGTPYPFSIGGSSTPTTGFSSTAGAGSPHPGRSGGPSGSPQNNAGGSATNAYGAAGGGGAGASGQPTPGVPYEGGSGGAGLSFFSGFNFGKSGNHSSPPGDYFAGGGAGGSSGVGGIGGGGQQGGNPGAANIGGGGGGLYGAPSGEFDGGSGVVIVKYPDTAIAFGGYIIN